MHKWRCPVCGYIYDPRLGDPESGLPPGIPLERLPDSWGCPDCGSPPDMFEEIETHNY